MTLIPHLLKPDQVYFGIDQNSKTIDRLRQKYSGITFLEYDLEVDTLDLDSMTFDTILMIAVIEHLKDPTIILGQISKLLSPNGKLIITTPTPIGGVIHSIGAYLGLFYKEAMADHKRYFTLKTLTPLILDGYLVIIGYRKFLILGNQLFLCKTRLNKKNVNLRSYFKSGQSH